ncbi:MAG: beta strand repeat-containing protein [Chthoniobacteraceae bacterium]
MKRHPSRIVRRPAASLAICSCAVFLPCILLPVGAEAAVSWIGTTDSSWATSTNWSGAVPASADTAYFNNAGNGNTTIDLGSGVTLGKLVFDTSSAAAYTIGAGGVGNQTFTTGSVGVTLTAAVVNNQTINANVVLGTDATAASYSFSNLSAKTLTIAGGIAGGTGGTAGAKTISLTGNGNFALSGPISDGGATVNIAKGGTGILTLSGSNSFSGGLSLIAGTLNINNASALGTGTFTLTAGTIDNTSGAALVLTTNNAIKWAGTSFVFGGTQDLNFGTGSVTSTLNNVITINGLGRTLTFGGTLTNTSTSGASLTVLGQGNTLVLGGFALSSGAAIVATGIQGNANVTITGAITNGNAYANILQYSGNATLTLQGANTFTGALKTVNTGATIKIDASTATFSGNNGLTFTMGGTINYDNTTSTSSRSQTFGAITFSGGEGTFQSTRTAAQDVAVTFSSIGTRGSGATGNFVTSGGVNGTSNSIILTTAAAGFLNSAYYYNGADFAATSGPGTAVRALAYGSDGSTAAVDTITAYNHVKLTSTPASHAGIILYTLNLSGAVDFTLSSGTLVLTKGGLLKSGGGSSTISGGVGITQGSSSELIIRTDTASDVLTVATPILATTAALTKSGSGTLVLSVANAYTGVTSINSGALRAVDGVGLVSTSLLQLRGGVLESNGTFTRTIGTSAGNVNWSTASGGFAANGGGLNITLNGGTSAVTWGSTNFVQDYRDLIFGSVTADNVVDFQNDLALGSVNRTIRVIDNTSTTSDFARVSGAISGSGGLIKEGAGLLELTNASNTYNGSTTINGGVLRIAAGSALASTSSIYVASGGEFNVNGTVNSAATTTISSGATLSGSGTASGAVGVTDGGAINGSGITIGATTLNGITRLTGTNTASSITVASGTASVKNGYTAATGTLSVAAGAKLENSASIAANSVNVISGGALTNNGTITSNLSVGGRLNGTGTINGDLSLASTATLAMGITGATTAGTDFDQVRVSGLVSLDGILDLTALSGLTTGDSITLILNSGNMMMSGSFSSVEIGGVALNLINNTFSYNNTKYQIGYNVNADGGAVANDLVLSVVPEPGTWAMLIGGLGLLAFGQRVRRNAGSAR